MRHFTYQFHDESFLGRRHSATHHRLTLGGEVQEEGFQGWRESVSESISINDDGECGLGSRNKATFGRLERGWPEDGRNLVDTGLDLHLS